MNLTQLRNLNLNPLGLNLNPLDINFNPLQLHMTDLQNLNPLNPVHRERMQHLFANLQTGTHDVNTKLQRAVSKIRSNEYREKMGAVLTNIKNTKEYQSTSMTDYDVVFESVDMYPKTPSYRRGGGGDVGSARGCFPFWPCDKLACYCTKITRVKNYLGPSFSSCSFSFPLSFSLYSTAYDVLGERRFPCLLVFSFFFFLSFFLFFFFFL
jgi:hypothetical protein